VTNGTLSASFSTSPDCSVRFTSDIEPSRADVAQATFDELTRRGMKSARMIPIPTSDYPTPAKRPAWSTLDTSKIEALGIETPDWRGRIGACV
jgi:dTDP-4-dehydrorhamnose reductase